VRESREREVERESGRRRMGTRERRKRREWLENSGGEM
jgi:hypothetical protein